MRCRLCQGRDDGVCRGQSQRLFGVSCMMKWFYEGRSGLELLALVKDVHSDVR